MDYRMPEHFLWGAATASFQVEGHLEADGAGPSNWLDFCRKPGTVANDDIPLVGASQYTLYKEDVQLMKSLGIKAYRFSIAWPRVFPEGTGAPNPKGLDYYNRLVDELLANGITPYVTVFHWDLPSALEQKGGWRSKETSRALADYAGYVASKLSDRVKNFFTVNEIICFTASGYEAGRFAPGLKLDPKTVNQTIYNGCLGHGLALNAIRANSPADVRVGLVDNPLNCVPVYETPEHIEAARKAFRIRNSRILTLIREGRFTDEYIAEQGGNMPDFTDSELNTIATPMDCLGLNIYTPEHIAADPASPYGYRIVPKSASHPAMNVEWLKLGPESIYWTLRFCRELWNEKTLYITENGCPAADRLTPEGEVLDTDRLMYLREHLRGVQRAAADGIPVKGYFVWSLLDNFEWADGFQKRFGIVYVNYSTLKRTPKLSAKFYRDTIAANAVL